MLRIRPEQMGVFEASLREVFATRVVRFLRDQLAAECAAIDEVALREKVHRGILAAGTHGITARWDVARFIACQLCLGEGFDTDPAHPWPRGVLARPNLGPSRKMDWIERHYLRPFRRRRPPAR